MRLLPSALAAFFLLVICAPTAFADEATTYAGTLGKVHIIVELQAPGKDGAFVGRYSFMSKGVDIPLHGMDAKGILTIREEERCTEKTCNTATDPVPIGAEWSLKPTGSGDGFEGSWTEKDSGKTFPIKPAKKGARTLPKMDQGSHLVGDIFSTDEDETSAVLTPKDLPFDFLKLDHPLEKGKVVEIGDSAYRMDLDSRSGLAFPTIIKLGTTDLAALDRRLLDERRQWEGTAFDCLSQAYLGNGWNGDHDQGTSGYHDGAAEVSVDYLTSRLMGFTESGGQFCGGGQPYFFDRHYIVDVKTGKLLTAQDLLADWVARDPNGNIVDPAKAEDPTGLIWGPGAKLLDYLDKNRYAGSDRDGDESASDDCRTDQYMRGNVGVYFKGSDLIFALADLGADEATCAAILTKVPIRDARSFLTKAGAAYFAELDK
jgi:hypothetical protein